MATTLEEAYNKAIQLFHSYYIGNGKNETFEIPNSVLREHGFETDFWNRLCPELREQGILKYFPIRFFSNTRVATKDKEKRNYLFEKAMKLLGNSSLTPEDKFAQEDALDKEFLSVEYFFEFVVNGKKLLRAYAKQSADGTLEQKDIDRVKIKSARLEGRVLMINGGDVTVPFSRRKSGDRKDDAPESIEFRIFKFFWDDRYENGPGARKQKGQMTAIDNLMRVSKAKSKPALKQHTNRINAAFKKRGLNIKIASAGEKYKLTIQYA